MVTSPESDGQSKYMQNYASVSDTQKKLYNAADVADEVEPESLIFAPIESNKITQTQITLKTLLKYKLLSETWVQKWWRFYECEVNHLQHDSAK